jgi:hypothetical protein
MSNTESSHVTLKPAVFDGQPLKVNKPQGGSLAAEGEPIMLTSYWRRRLADGDVLRVSSTETTANSTANSTASTTASEASAATASSSASKSKA